MRTTFSTHRSPVFIPTSPTSASARVVWIRNGRRWMRGSRLSSKESIPRRRRRHSRRSRLRLPPPLPVRGWRVVPLGIVGAGGYVATVGLPVVESPPFPFYHSPQTTGLTGDDVGVELQVLQMARTIRGKLLDPFHADMVANTSALFNAAIVSGDLHLAADYCAELISYYRHM